MCYKLCFQHRHNVSLHQLQTALLLPAHRQPGPAGRPSARSDSLLALGLGLQGRAPWPEPIPTARGALCPWACSRFHTSFCQTRNREGRGILSRTPSPNYSPWPYRAGCGVNSITAGMVVTDFKACPEQAAAAQALHQALARTAMVQARTENSAGSTHRLTRARAMGCPPDPKMH